MPGMQRQNIPTRILCGYLSRHCEQATGTVAVVQALNGVACMCAELACQPPANPISLPDYKVWYDSGTFFYAAVLLYHRPQRYSNRGTDVPVHIREARRGRGGTNPQ